MKKCDYCGRENEDAVFQCAVCGKPLPGGGTVNDSADGEYEFSADQEGIIGSVGSAMRIVGIVLFIVGALQVAGALIAGAFVNSLSSGVQGVIGLILGTFTLNAGTAFREIASTKGKDIEHLMEALVALRSLYRLQVWLLIIAVIVVAIGLIFLLIGKP